MTSTGIGNVLNLPVLSQQLNPSTGQILRTVQDVSGALIQVTLDNAGKVLGTTVLRQATGVGGQALGTVGPTAQSLTGAVGGVAQSLGGVTGAVSGVTGGVPAILGGQRGRVETSSGGEVSIGNLVGPTNPLGAVAGVAGAAGNVLGGVQQLVLGSVVNGQGQTVQRIVDVAGSLVERVIHPTTGQLLSTKALGNVLSLPVVREQALGNGTVQRVVRDASGTLLELTILNGALQTVKRVTDGVLNAPVVP